MSTQVPHSHTKEKLCQTARFRIRERRLHFGATMARPGVTPKRISKVYPWLWRLTRDFSVCPVTHRLRCSHTLDFCAREQFPREACARVAVKEIPNHVECNSLAKQSSTCINCASTGRAHFKHARTKLSNISEVRKIRHSDSSFPFWGLLQRLTEPSPAGPPQSPPQSRELAAIRSVGALTDKTTQGVRLRTPKIPRENLLSGGPTVV